MDSLRRTALVVGVLFVITYVTSIPAKFSFYPPFLDNPDYILGSGEDTRVLWGAFAEMILIIADIGTAVALYPVLKRRSRPCPWASSPHASWSPSSSSSASSPS